MIKYFEGIDLTKSQMKILNRLQYEPLSLIQIACNNPKNVYSTQKSLKYLTLNGLVDIEVKPNKRRYQTLYLLTDNGRKIVNIELNTRLKHSGPLYNKSFLIDGIEFKSKKQVIEYITELCKTYSEGDYLTPPHQKFIMDCLRATEWGLKLIPLTCNIKVVTNTDCLALINNDQSEYIIRYHMILSDEARNHNADVKTAFKRELRHGKYRIPMYGLHKFHDGLSFSEIVDQFLESKHLAFGDIKVHRVDNNLVITDENIRADWIIFHNNNAKIILLPKDELDLRYAQKNAIKTTISKCQNIWGNKCQL
jgi:hypothetical protein